MLDSLSGAESVFLPGKWLIDSGSDINICDNYDLSRMLGRQTLSGAHLVAAHRFRCKVRVS